MGKPRIKVLCLHGMGVNGDVFAMQTAAFRALLPPHYHFTFIDGGVSCAPSPGVENLYSGPYKCFYESPSTERVAAAHLALETAVKTKGPFQLVMGFSQGAALAASYLLQCELEGRAFPFDAAVFICSPLPFAKNPDHGFECRKHFGHEPDTDSTRPNDLPKYLLPDSYFLRSAYDDDECPPDYNMYHSTVDEVRLTLPTAHIVGRNDSWRPHSLDLADLCTQKLVIEHYGGHEVPRGASGEICDIFEEVVALAGIHPK